MINILKPLILKIKDISYNLGLIDDFVIEQGTDGIWTYRKWNSGIAECWGTPYSETLTMAASGNIYRSEPATFSIPVFLKSVEINVYNSHSANVIGIANYGSLDTTNHTISVRVQKSTNDTSSVKFAAKLVGKWK